MNTTESNWIEHVKAAVLQVPDELETWGTQEFEDLLPLHRPLLTDEYVGLWEAAGL